MPHPRVSYRTRVYSRERASSQDFHGSICAAYSRWFTQLVVRKRGEPEPLKA